MNKDTATNLNSTAPATFGEHLRTVRGDCTRKDLAEAVGVSENYIAQLESGRRSPSVKLATRLAEELLLTGKHRDSFLSAATGLTISATHSKAPQSELGGAVDRFLRLSRGEVGVENEFRNVLRDLIAQLTIAGVARGIGRQDRAAARGLEILTSLIPSDEESCTSHDRRVRVLQEQVLELFSHVANGAISIDKRIAMLKKINSELSDNNQT